MVLIAVGCVPALETPTSGEGGDIVEQGRSATSVAPPTPTPTLTFALGLAAAKSTAGPVLALPSPQPTPQWYDEPPPRDLAPDESGWSCHVSPDGRWVAEIGASESVELGSEGTGWGGYYRGMRFVNAADGITHTLFATWTEAGIPGLVPTLVGWDADGRHAYVYEIANACCCHHRDTGYVLERVDLDTGARVILVSDLSTPRISPTGDAIAYVSSPREPNHVKVLDLESGRVMASDAFDGLVSDMSWSPSGRRLALVLVTDRCANEPEMSTALLIDRESGRTAEPWAPMREAVRQAKWLDEARIELVGEAGGTRLVDVGEY